MKGQIQPLSLSNRQSRERAQSTITTSITEAATSRWGLLIAATSVRVSVFRLRMPITGHMAGIAIEARRIALNVAKLPELIRH
jgi:hypothetical protein